MDSLVLELQREAYSQSTSVSSCLRKAYVLARKLNIKELIEWTNSELNGYKNLLEVPEYRKVKGFVKALNPYYGYIPVHIEELEDVLTNRVIDSTITEIEQLVHRANENGGNLISKFPSKIQLDLVDITESEFEFSLHMPVTQFSRIVDCVRNIIIEWTLKLEEIGVLGENMTFNEKDKIAANQIPFIINNIGTMNNSQIQQNTNNSNQNLNIEQFQIESLKEILRQGNSLLSEISDTQTKKELQSDLSALEAQVTSPNPKNGIIKECLLSLKNIAEGVVGSLIATTIVSHILPLISML